MRLRRMVPLLLVLAVVAPSCGGDGSVFDASTIPPTAEPRDLIDAEALAVAEAIVAALGPEPGLLAVSYALDRGYTATQIAEAGSGGTLQADGTITGVEPELPLWSIFADLPHVSGSGTGGGIRPAPSVFRFAEEPNPYEIQIRADQWIQGAATEFDRVMSGLPTPSAPGAGGSSSTTTEPPVPNEGERATIMIGLIMQLSALGYSAEQIILGISLREQHAELVATALGPMGCWMLKDSAGGRMVRPALPQVVTAFPGTSECREAIDRLAPPDAGSTTTTTSSPTTSAAAVDADGVLDGLYLGEVRVAGEVTAPVYEILDGEIRLDVTDQRVQAEVEYTLRLSIRSRLEEPVCIATIDYLYVGQQPALVTLGFPLEPMSQSIRLLEGSQCGIVDPWQTTAEDYLLSSFAEERTITLAGSFGDGRFEGYISGTPLAVTASIGG